MPFIGNKPSAVPLTSADIADGIITSAKIVDGTIVNADINASSAIAISKIAATGTSLQVLRMNTGATALEFATATSAANTPAFSVYQSSTHSISNATHTKIQFQTEILDSNNNFDSTTNYRFTPSTAGYYLLTVGLRCDCGSAEYFLQLYKNGSNFLNLRDDVFTNYQLNGSALVYANGTDYFEVFFFQNSGSSKTTASGAAATYFSGFRILGV